MNIQFGKEKYSERLAKYVIIAIFLAIAVLVCKLFGNVIMYILGAAVVSLVGRPLMIWMGKIRIRKKPIPIWLCALVTILLVVSVFLGILFLVTPVFTGIASDISKANITDSARTLIRPLRRWNDYLRMTFPSLGADFKIENFLLSNLNSIFDVSKFSNVISGLASFVASFGVGLFSIIFISFFFVKNENLFANIIVSFIPDEYEARARESMGEIMGVILAVIIKYCCATSYGLDVQIVPFMLIVLGIMLCAQFVDNVVYQPLIYSSSIKAHPLEIFIVLLLGGSFGGILGMLIAVPAYTVVRVVAIHFFGDVKAVQRLTGGGQV